jgi:hypothetical protein
MVERQWWAHETYHSNCAPKQRVRNFRTIASADPMDWPILVLAAASVVALVVLAYKMLLSPYVDGRSKKREDDGTFPRPQFGTFPAPGEMDGVRRRGGAYGASLSCAV